jgi:hypothetical protein
MKNTLRRVAAVLMSLPLPAAARVTTDAGTIYPSMVESFFNRAGYSPYAGHAYPMRPLWGEIHLHTSWSPNAIMAGTRVVRCFGSPLPSLHAFARSSRP